MAYNDFPVNIPGRLKSAAVGGVVADAEDIYDDTLGKSQHTINSETEGRLDGQDTKIDRKLAEIDTKYEEFEERTDELFEQERIDNRNAINEATSSIRANDTIVVEDHTVVATPEANKIYREYGETSYADWQYQNNAWVKLAEYNHGIDDEPTAGSDNLVKSGGVQNELALGAVYDVSAKNPTAGPNSDGKWESLSALLSDASLNTLIPSAVRKGGMSVKIVQSSDNKYVQYRCTADEFTTDTTQWAISDVGVYVENPEFVYVKTDSEGKILWAIKIDGGIYYGAGVPQQVIDYINEKIAELSLDEYEDIVAFLSDYLGSDTTLKAMIDGINAQIATKVDKEEGKSLIDAEYASSCSAIENPEFIEVKTDVEDKILEAMKEDGTKVIYTDFQVLGKMEVSGVSYKIIENPEYIAAWVDAEYKVIFGLKADGKTYIGDANFLDDIKDNQEAIAEIKTTLTTIGAKVDSLDIDALTLIAVIENPEFIEAKTDSEGKLLAGRTPDGAAFENVGFSTPNVSIDGHTIENAEDPEGRSEITTDSEGKIISYRDADGVKHENVGIETKDITLSKEGILNFKDSLEKNIKYNRPSIPLYGTVNIKQETFYLTSDSRYSDITGVEVRQELEDNDANAAAKLTIAHYYIKNTDVRLDFYAATKVTLVGEKYYVTDSLEDGQVVPTSIEVTQVVGAPDVRTWPVDKKTEHHCIVDFDFGDFYVKNNVAVGVKFQGSSTLECRKRNFRFTFYKNNKYKKKDKVKFGEMLRLSGYNLKANWTDNSRVKEMILYPTLLAVWQQRPESNRFPWSKEFTDFSAATGFIQGFPIRLYIAGDFYGMMIFGLKKDEKNYVLDGDDDSSGIFVSGTSTASDCWTNLVISTWEDEMMDEMSQDTANAITEWFDFINDRLVDNNQNPIPFNIKNIPSRLDVQGFIDYFICMQVFIMWDNTQRNMVLHTRSDKQKFYPFFYDLDNSLNYNYDSDVFSISTQIVPPRDMSFWETVRDTFWDDIVNRYHYLRETVLNYDYINQIYHALADNIPDEDFALENQRWGTNVSKNNANTFLQTLKNRLVWLDDNYFIINK